MKKLLIRPLDHRFYFIGLMMLLASFSIYLVFEYNETVVNGDVFAYFVPLQTLSLVHLICLLGHNNSKHGAMMKFHTRRNNIIAILLWTVSAYMLNKMMAVFAESVPWLSAWIMTYSAALLLISLLHSLGKRWIDYVLLCVLSLGMVFHFYQTLMTLSLYPITLVSFWLFGISLHALVPLFSFFICLGIVREYLASAKRFKLPATICFTMTAIVLFIFVYKWNAAIRATEKGYVSFEQPYEGNDLPSWCTLGQTLPDDGVTKRILGGANEFVTASDLWDWNRLGWTGRRKKHDPLVLVSSMIAGHLDLSWKERNRIAETLYNKRHQAEWKLWSGDDLITDKIETTAQLFPAERMAYTEKTIDIKNTRKWGQQEALYTFFVPEGSVVTSASLWINGKEEPSYLTTKTKADSAYKAIVGRERRDPLLVHWQEGNRVTARIFPVTHKEPRKFKLGVTSPLAYEDGQLTYQNIDFKGPKTTTTLENINLLIEGEEKVDISTPIAFAWDLSKYKYNGMYYSDWDLSIEAPPLNTSAFSFNDKSFRLLDLEYEEKGIDQFRKVYLDVNGSWSKSMFKSVLKKCAGNQVYMLDGESIVLLSDKNAMKHFKKARKNNFSVFPIYKIADPHASLLISNNDHITPVLKDFKDSPFEKKLSTFMDLSAGQLMFLNVGKQNSQYLQSLVELKSIIQSSSDYDSFMDDGIVKIPKTLDNATAINMSQTQILETMGNELYNAGPDHLMRLHSYNSLMKTIGKDFSRRKEIENDHISVAEDAHILSPISSMIVLETQADYDRFDIDTNRKKSSLGNAKLDGAGSVPEPHEWALILILIAALLFLHVKTRIV